MNISLMNNQTCILTSWGYNRSLLLELHTSIMGHRHLFNASQMLENDHESWNMNAEQPYMHLARGNAVENSPFFYPMENMSSGGVHFTPPWNSQTRSNGYTPMGHNELKPPCHPDAGSSQGPYMHRSNVAAVSGVVSENYYPNVSSSNYERQTSYGIEGGFTDIPMDCRRVHQKRKSPGIPVVCERGNSSVYYSRGTSYDVPICSEFRQEIPIVDAQHIHWDHLAAAAPGYTDKSISIRGDGSLRNVRSRSGLDLESNVTRTYLSDNTNNSWSASHAIEHPGAVDFSGLSSSNPNPNPNPNPLATDWSHVDMSPAHGRIVVSDPRGFSHELNHFAGGSSSGNSRVETGGYDFTSSRYPPVVSQAFHGTSSHVVRGPRNSYSQRSSPSFRSSSSTSLGNAGGPSDEGLQPVAESYSRHPRPLSSTGWRNNDRNRRSRISNDRYRSYPDEACAHDRMAHEGFMMMERSSRSSVDQHRELRLDIDNMSYEELLALGERIGTVNTGLSEDSISKCMRETIHCASDQLQDEERCVICLEEYKNMDDVGMLKACRHDFHVTCIKRWLSMKNMCPICKGTALADENNK